MLLERGRIVRFARAIGETNPVFLDVDQARAAGHPDVPVPPTYLFTLESEGQDTLAFAAKLGVDPIHVLHGEQEFTHVDPVFASDEVLLRTSITEDRLLPDKGLRIVKRRTEISREDRVACRLTSTWVIREHHAPNEHVIAPPAPAPSDAAWPGALLPSG